MSSVTLVTAADSASPIAAGVPVRPLPPRTDAGRRDSRRGRSTARYSGENDARPGDPPTLCDVASALDLDSPRWAELTHAYGRATDVPALLGQLRDVPSSDGESEPWFSLWSALAHQGDVYSASFAAVPHVVAALAVAPERADFSYFQFPAWVEICRKRTSMDVPADLARAYFDALAQLPVLVAPAADREWDDALVLSALAAIAASKAAHDVAEAVLELTPDVVAEFQTWGQRTNARTRRVRFPSPAGPVKCLLFGMWRSPFIDELRACTRATWDRVAVRGVRGLEPA